MPHDHIGEGRDRRDAITPEESRAWQKMWADREHEQAVRRCVDTVISAIRGSVEPYPGVFEEAADSLADFLKKGDPVSDRILGTLDDAGTMVKTVLARTRRGNEQENSELYTVKYGEDGTMVITNLTMRLIMVSLSSQADPIRLAPGEIREIKSEIKGHVQTMAEWSQEKKIQDERNFVSAVARKKDEARGGRKWNQPLGFGGYSSSGGSH